MTTNLNLLTPTNYIHSVNLSQLQQEALSIQTQGILSGNLDPTQSSAAIALALWQDTRISTEQLRQRAADIVSQRSQPLSTFSPLYITNYCDAQCKMCGMRNNNQHLIRKFASKQTIEEQLDILYEEENIHAVAILTGEYEDKYTRLSNMFRVGWTVRTALDKGFKHILINIGSLSTEEIDVFKEWVNVSEPVMLSVFQETYHRATYQKFMGKESHLPKTNFDQRLQSYDHWLNAGFNQVNPGLLIGLYKPEEEMLHLLTHLDWLSNKGARIDISIPRLRPANGIDRNKSKMNDDQYLRFMAAIAIARPNDRVILTTREAPDFQEKAIDICGVFSPGSPDVTPYNRASTLVNEESSSQFLVADLRRPSDILTDYQNRGYHIHHFTKPMIARIPAEIC